MSNPNPTTPTPLPSQWDSAIIRQLAYAALGLLATVAADFFGVTRELIEEKGGRLIEAVLTLLIVAVPLYLAYRARKYKPTPPITAEAVQATAQREVQISNASPSMKETAAKSPLIIGVFAILLACLSMLQGCAANPHKTAQTVEQHGDAIYGELTILKEQGARVIQDATVSDDVKRPIAEGIVAAKPITDGMQDTLILYAKVKAEVATGASTPDKLAVVDRELAAWIAQAQPIISKLAAAIAGARK